MKNGIHPPRNRRKTAKLKAKKKKRVLRRRLKNPAGKRAGQTHF